MTAPLEVVGQRAPLAVRCVDSVTGAGVADGLLATAWPVGDRTALHTARRSPVSTLIGFAELPGLYAATHSRVQGPGRPPWPPVAPLPFVLRIDDTAGRYLPTLLAVTAPVAAPVPVTLYSGPARPAPPGWATVRGEVHTPDDTPAAWCLVTVDTGADRHHTLADERGRFVRYLPYPEALPPLAGSPPVGTGLSGVHWTIRLEVGYELAAQIRPLGDDGPPELTTLLAQRLANVLDHSVPAPALTTTLALGAPLVLSVVVDPA